MNAFEEMAAAAKRASEGRLRRDGAAGGVPDALHAEVLPLLEEAKAGFAAAGVPCTIRVQDGGRGRPAGIEFFCGFRRVRLRSTGATTDIKGVSMFVRPGGAGPEVWLASTRAAPVADQRLEGDLAAAIRHGAAQSLRTYFGELEGWTELYGIVF